MKNIILLITLFISGITFAQNNLEDYKPVLESTLKKAILVDYNKGYAIQEVKPNIYVLTDGIWQLYV